MTDITPPPELVQQWVAEIWHEGTPVRVSLSDEHIATHAAQWGADQELDACCQWLRNSAIWTLRPEERLEWVETLAMCRRPSLKKQALDELHISFDRGYLKEGAADIIRRALEQLDD